MAAVALLKGGLTAEDYEDQAAADPHIDQLREKMRVVENERFTQDYLDPEKRSIANAVRVLFRDGAATGRVEVEYPLGHRRRRAEGIPLLRAKFERAVAGLGRRKAERILGLLEDPSQLAATPAGEFMGLWSA
jgi:2-methylcitrate dehydratase